MLYQAGSQDTTYENDLIQSGVLGTSSQSIGIPEGAFLWHWSKKAPQVKLPFPFDAEFGWSSLRRYFEIDTDTSSARELAQGGIFEDTLEYDVLVHMPPKSRRVVQIEAKNIKKGTPRMPGCVEVAPEHDVLVHMPPKSRRVVQIEAKNIKRGTPSRIGSEESS